MATTLVGRSGDERRRKVAVVFGRSWRKSAGGRVDFAASFGFGFGGLA